MREKSCKICGASKELSQYYSQVKINKDGEIYTWYNTTCKKCYIKRQGIWVDDNIERHNEYYKKYYKTKNRFNEERNAYVKHTTSEWRKSNPEKCIEYSKLHRNHDITEAEWRACLKVFNNMCAYCGLKSEDHIATRNGKQIIMNFHKEHVDDHGYNDLRNAIPSCQHCNSGKRSSDMEEWFREQKFFTEEKLQFINWWIEDGYKKYIKYKPPYKIVRKKNEEDNMFHSELWSMDEQRNRVELIKIGNNKKELTPFALEFFGIKNK